MPTIPFKAFAVWATDNLNLTGAAEPVQVLVARVSPGFFPALGLQPELGRFFNESEGHPGGKSVVVLSNAVWHSRFHGDRNIVGQSITLDQTPFTIIGVLPANVQFLFAPILFMAVAALASYIPASRTTKLNPVEALR